MKAASGCAGIHVYCGNSDMAVQQAISLLQPGLPIGGLEGTFLNLNSDPECLKLTVRFTIPQDLLWNKGAYSHNMPKSSLDRRTFLN